MMTDDGRPTYWAMHDRDINRLREDMREGFNNINTRLDKMPTSETLLLITQNLQNKLTEVEDDNATLKQALADDQANRRKERQWVIGAVAVPIVLLGMTLFVTIAGWFQGG